MRRIVAAALAYWAWVFAAGFVLGTLRTLWVAPRTGLLAAVLLELPAMLLVSFAAARAVLRRYSVTRTGEALALGVLAFVLLLLAEAALAVLLGGQGAAQWARLLAAPPGAVGLAGQMVFALLPWALVRWR
ncbi:hypothetical protein [Novosphingobium sp.]|uniref:hypothetical protein n=1 Tax=Novosphingobium sp. TaxID=1874826 RepID=UPI0025ED9D5A|nr:hypothetical protein [Novosphingobium sp.]